MAKGTVLRVRVSDDLYRKIKIICRERKSVSDYVRDAIKKDLKEAEEEAVKFSDLISKIESTDLARMSRKVDQIITALGDMRVLEDILYFARRADIAIEEYGVRRLARSDFIKDYLEKINSESKKEISRQ